MPILPRCVCDHHSTLKYYNKELNAWYCSKCDAWLSECDVKNCTECKSRCGELKELCK